MRQASATYSDTIDGGIGVAKLGENTLTLPTANTFTGGTTVTGGTLKLTAGNNPLAITGAITITGGALDLGGNTQVTSGNVIIKGGSIQNGILETSGNLTIQGGSIQSGILRRTVAHSTRKPARFPQSWLMVRVRQYSRKSGSNTLVLSG